MLICLFECLFLIFSKNSVKNNSIFYVFVFFVFAFEIRMLLFVLSIVLIVFLSATLEWLVEKIFSLMIEMKLHDFTFAKERDKCNLKKKKKLMILWNCWVIWSLKFPNTFLFIFFICVIKFKCQWKFTFFTTDRIIS